MRISLKTTLAAALPLASLLWITPPAVAHYDYRSYEHRHPWAESYRYPHSGRYSAWERRHRYGSSWQYGKNHWKYNKAMNRLARQEREARARTYRHYEGDRNNLRYRERLA